MKYKVESLVVKIANVCNLNCSYCYVFNLGDEHYVDIPNKMSEELCDQLLFRIKEHCLEHRLNRFVIIFHGGEPLILGIPYYENFLAKAEKLFRDTHIHLGYVMQSNGTLMTDKWAKFLTDNKIHVGFSIDGYESIHNQNRVYRSNGRGSYQDVIKGINIYRKYQPNIDVLSVLNTDADPELFYQTIKDLKLHSLGLLFRDHNYNDIECVDFEKTTEWAIRLFDLWFDDKEKGGLKVLTPFTTLINLLLGMEWVGNDAYGEVMNNALLILSNGEIQVTGVEKPSKDTKAYFLQENKLNEVFKKKIFRDYYNLHQERNLCEQCLNCLIRPICGGGRYSHRFSKENGFNNPTIYCDTMKRLVVHIQNRVYETLPEELKEKTQLQMLCYEEL